jgi:hypothetical protein
MKNTIVKLYTNTQGAMAPFVLTDLDQPYDLHIFDNTGRETGSGLFGAPIETLEKTLMELPGNVSRIVIKGKSLSMSVGAFDKCLITSHAHETDARIHKCAKCYWEGTSPTRKKISDNITQHFCPLCGHNEFRS